MHTRDVVRLTSQTTSRGLRSQQLADGDFSVRRVVSARYGFLAAAIATHGDGNVPLALAVLRRCTNLHCTPSAALVDVVLTDALRAIAVAAAVITAVVGFLPRDPWRHRRHAALIIVCARDVALVRSVRDVHRQLV